MKFLCGNCKAKYQIADEKVSGKTLRMKCRRCGHDILIDGHNMPASNPPAAAASASTMRGGPASVPVPTRAATAEPAPRALPAAPPRPPMARSKPPSALGSEFRRHMAAPPEVPQRAPYDLWHVAIKDVPVGPMTRAELGRKIETGAVTAESLCWREGMDDWRPLGELPELAQLLRRGFEGSRSGRLPSRPRVPPVPAPQGPRVSSSQYPAVEEFEEDHNEPTRVADSLHGSSAALAPVMQGAPHTSGTSPKIVLPQQAAVVAAEVPVAVPAAAAERPARGGSQLITGVAIGLLAGILFIGGPALYRATWGSTPAPVATQPVASAPVAEKAAPAAERVPQAEEHAGEEKPHAATKTKVAGTAIAPRPVKPEPGKETKQLSAEDQALLNRMGVGGPGGPNLAGPKRETESAPATGPALTPAQLSKVVQDNKVQLQRCYETALRAAGGKQEGAIKVTVSVTVGTSGSTKLATTEGAGLGNMNDCIRGAVKRWRFPQSGGESEFQFPLVFQPGA